MEEEDKKFREQEKICFIVGFTGESGKALVQELVNRNIFQKIRLLGRRTVSYPDEEKYKVLEQRVIDFENLESHKADFTGCDVGYCCLGTTRRQSGKDGFYKVDHDYIVNSAKVAREAGCKEYHLVSSVSANPNSMFFYLKVKGQAEEELKSLDFDKFRIYRPAGLLCEREDNPPGEAILKGMLKPITWCSPTLFTIPITTLAKGMVNATVEETEEGADKVQVLENKPIFRMAGEL